MYFNIQTGCNWFNSVRREYCRIHAVTLSHALAHTPTHQRHSPTTYFETNITRYNRLTGSKPKLNHKITPQNPLTSI